MTQTQHYDPDPPLYSTGNAWTDGYNMAVLGKSQTGKTAACKELHATSPRFSIWLNEPGKNRVDGVAGKVVRTVGGVVEAMRNGHQKVNFVSDDRNAALPQLQSLAWEIADNTGRDFQGQLLIDELDRVAPQSGKSYGNLPARDACRDFTSEGIKRGWKFVGITQDPVKMDKQTLRQSEYRLIFDMSNEQRKSSVVKKMGLNFNAVDETGRYTGVLHNDAGQVLEREVKAEARFA